MQLGFHLHRLGDQHRLALLDPVADGHQHVDDVARHGGGHVAGAAGTGAAALWRRLIAVAGLEHHRLGHAVQGQVDLAASAAVATHAGDLHVVGLAVNVDHEFGGGALADRPLADVRRRQRFGDQAAVTAPLQEVAADVGKQRIGQHVLLTLGKAADRLAKARHLRRQQVRRAALLGRLLAHRQAPQLRVGRGRRAPVAAQQIALDLVADGLVALAGEHVGHRLGADELRGRRDQRRIAEVGTHPRDLVEHLANSRQCVLFAQLVGEIRHHSAGHLADQHADVLAGHLALETGILSAHLAQPVADRLDRLEVEPGVVVGVLEGRHHRLTGRMAGAAGKGRTAGVEMTAARLHRLQMALRSQPRRGVGVQVYRHFDGIQQCGDQLGSGVGREQPGHVLDGDGVGAHRHQPAGVLDVHLQVMHRTHGVADRALGVLAGGLDRRHGGLQVAQVVERIEHPEDIDAARRGARHEGLHHVIGVVAVADQVLATQQHLQRRVGQRSLEPLQALPGVLLEEAHAGVEGRPAPYLQRLEANGVERRAHRQHVVGAQPRGDQRLMAVAQHHIAEAHPGVGVGGHVSLPVRAVVHRPAWAAMAAATTSATSSGLRFTE